MYRSIPLNTKHTLTQPHECLLVYFVRDSSHVDFLVFELVVRHSLQSLLTPLLVDVPVLLEIEQGEHVGYLLFGEDPCLEPLLLLQFQSLDNELFHILRLLEADV